MKDLLCDTDSVLITAVLFVSITISKETPMLTVSFARIRAGQESRLRDWLAELATRQDEARLSLAQEGTRHEQLYVLPGADGAVLVYVMEADDVQQAYSAYGASQLPIDVEHRAVLAQVLEAPLEIAPLYECSAAPPSGAPAWS